MGTKRRSTQIHYDEAGFPPGDLDAKALLPLVGEVSREVGRYSRMLETAPDAETLLSPLAMQEAVFSSLIEGIHSRSEDAYLFLAGGGGSLYPEDRRDDAFEALCCREALASAGAEVISSKSLTGDLLRSAHGKLMQGHRNVKKQPGKYRDIQNWIGDPRLGPYGHGSFFPPPPERIGGCMERLVRFIGDSDAGKTDPLVAIALAHAEFEGIHPFVDGNGRTGRMLVPLMARSLGLLSRPALFVSENLYENRPGYYRGLKRVSRDGDWTGWCSYFLTAMHEQTRLAHRRLTELSELRASLEEDVARLEPKECRAIAEFLFLNPMFRAEELSEATELTNGSVHRVTDHLARDGIVKALDSDVEDHAEILTFPGLLGKLKEWEEETMALAMA